MNLDWREDGEKLEEVKGRENIVWGKIYIPQKKKEKSDISALWGDFPSFKLITIVK